MRTEEIYKIAHSKVYTTSELLELAELISANDKDVYVYRSLPKLRDFLKDQTDEHLLIMFPVYNEEASILTSLKSLLNSSRPKGKYLNILFILNNCTDSTKELLISELTPRYKLIRKELEYKFDDQGLNNKYEYFDIGNGCIKILETSTIGKVNALKVGTQYAQYTESYYFISFDTDFILEPQTIAVLTDNAQEKIYERKETYAIVGAPIIVTKANTRFQFRSKIHYAWDGQSYQSLSGCCMVLKTDWAIQNYLDVLIEDYALGLKIRLSGREVYKAQHARLWGFQNNSYEEFKQLERSIIGRLQLSELDENFKHQILRDNFFMQNGYIRLRQLWWKVLTKPKSILRYFAQYLYIECAILSARYQFYFGLKKVTWEKLRSSKL